LPGGQCFGVAVKPSVKNILIFRISKSLYIDLVLSHSEGRLATSRTRDRMRWTWKMPTTKVSEADGEVVWS
jgi:hypothetical protein